MIAKAPRGTKDVLPYESYKWHYIEDAVREITRLFDYKEIRTPTFEHTELFERGVGETTDVVQKEMYTFEDKGGRSITLKPEGTAGTVRAYIEGGLHSLAQPIKMYYITPVFRYEKPQTGRLREHHQFGVEVFGAPQASIDAEIIALAMTLLDKLNVKNLELNINSIGCPVCRPKYHTVLKEYLAEHLNDMCDNCKERFERNPLRSLDCKEEKCKKATMNAPVMLDYLCDECEQHFEELKQYLEASNIPFKVNPMIVRGLDYYTKTVFEIIYNGNGSGLTVCGGGRYDGLVALCGGPDTPGAGFGMGLERLIMVLEEQGAMISEPDRLQVMFITRGEEARYKAFQMISSLRQEGIPADMDHLGRSIRAQFKYADKLNVPYVCILGQDEIEKDQIKIRDMETGKETDIPMDQLVYCLKEMLEQ
ncbi:MAG: histidine--tRNA ligase [Clostridiales bacterium]|nr:histidine--tRNA ligase [Clostridiales bacterium]